jgi:hypothetical protein
MLTEQELKRRIKAAGEIRRWYQSVPYGTVRSPDQNFGDGKTDARSFGEGRWRNYIQPMIAGISGLDAANSTLCEVGCSAGLFLLKAWHRFGFRKLLGVEAGQGGYAQLLITRDYYDDMPLVPYNVSVGHAHKDIAYEGLQPIDLYTFPIVDITLLSVVHYYMQPRDLEWYLQVLALKSLHLIILTDEDGVGIIPSSADYIDQLVHITGGWMVPAHLETRKEWLQENGPQKRDKIKRLTGLVYTSNHLKRLSIVDCWNYVVNANRYAGAFYNTIFPKFIDAVLAGEINESNLAKTQVYNWQIKGHFGSTAWRPNVAMERVRSYYDMVLSIKDHGQEQPITINPLGMVDRFDGFHRIAVLKHFGYKYVYGRDAICSDQM